MPSSANSPVPMAAVNGPAGARKEAIKIYRPPGANNASEKGGSGQQSQATPPVSKPAAAPVPAPVPANGVSHATANLRKGGGSGTRGGGRGGRGGHSDRQPNVQQQQQQTLTQRSETQVTQQASCQQPAAKLNTARGPKQEGGGAKERHVKGTPKRNLQPSGYDMQPAPTNADANKVEANQAQRPVNEKGQQKQGDRGKGGKGDCGKGDGGEKGPSEAYKKFMEQERISRQRRQDEVMARHLAQQQEEEERSARVAALEEEMAGPLKKHIKLQATTVWGKVASGEYKSQDSKAPSVDAKAAAAIAQAMSVLADKTGVEAMSAGEELAQLVKSGTNITWSP